MPRKILNWGYNKTQFLFEIWATEEIHGKLLVMTQNPVFLGKRTKIQSEKR